MTAFLVWTPRLLGVVTAMFLASFALDAFGTDAPFLPAAGGFLIHLAPAAAVAALVGVAWRYPVSGGLMLIALSAAPFVLPGSAPGVSLLLAAPIFVCGVLFVLGAAGRIRHAPV